ncbi:hypothetical protein C8R44DRAFT_755482 [Mycena epipterygia]|nr:hypothetical protein C8R44DRAFT_755482 [Mycena epipterygia]
MSTDHLLAVVKRLVLGPEAWSPPRTQARQPKYFSKILHKLPGYRGRPLAPDPPRNQAPRTQVCADIVLHPAIPPAQPVPNRTQFEVLRGGKYALFFDGGGAQDLGCWRVDDDSLLGTYQSILPQASVHILDFAAEVLHGGERANIVIRICREDV